MLSPGISSSMKSCAETVISKYRGGRGGGHVGVPLGSDSVRSGWRGRGEAIPGRGPRRDTSACRYRIGMSAFWRGRKCGKMLPQRCDRCWGFLPGPAKQGERTLGSTLCLALRLSASGLWVPVFLKISERPTTSIFCQRMVPLEENRY